MSIDDNCHVEGKDLSLGCFALHCTIFVLIYMQMSFMTVELYCKLMFHVTQFFQESQEQGMLLLMPSSRHCLILELKELQELCGISLGELT